MTTSEVIKKKSAAHRPVLSNKYMYNLQDVSVSFGDIQALRSINLSIGRGDVLFITGASGAGKTTLLNVIAGDIDPTQGQVKKYLDSRHQPPFATRVYQHGCNIKSLSLEDNLMLSFDRQLYKDKNEFYHDMQELAQFLGMKDSLAMKTANANGGLVQKMALIRALLSKPDVVLADEPTSSLDRHNAFRVFELLNFYNARKKLTVLWATHNRDLVKQFTGKMVHLENGKLVYSGHACFI